MNFPPLRTRRQRGAAIAAVVLLFTVVSILSTNGYYYGVSDHSIAVPFVKSSIDGDLYPGDYLIAQKPFNYTFFWETIALLVERLGVSIQVVFFVFYFAALYATFLAVYLIAVRLFGKPEVALLAMFFLLFSAPTLGGVKTIDPLLNTRVAATPILLFALYFYLGERFRLSYFLQGAAFLVHPLSALYMFVMLLAATALRWKAFGARRLLSCLGILALAAAPVILWRLVQFPADAGFFEIDREWLALMQVRNSDHAFPFWFNGWLFLRAGILFGVFLLSWRRPPEAAHHRVIVRATGAVLAMSIAGTLFTELYPTFGVIQLQLFRSFQFIVFLTAIYAANFILAALRESRGFGARLAAGLIPFGILFRAVEAGLAYLGALTLAALLLGHVAVRRRAPGPVYSAGAFVAAALAMLIWNTDGLDLKDVQDHHWREAQSWAREHTGRADVFIVPPDLSGFRVGAERTSYGDWKDGTQMFFDPAFRREWIRRMRKLGYDGDPGRIARNYRALGAKSFTEIAAEFRGPGRAVYAILPREARPKPFPVVFRNERYRIYAIAP